MKKFMISNNRRTFEFAFEKYKLFLGKNYPLKYDFIQFIKQYSSRCLLSECQEENGVEFKLTIDDRNINERDLDVVYITPHYDLQSDLKMAAKSLILKYLESKLNKIDLLDNLGTLNIIMDGIYGEVNDEDDVFNFKSEEITIKTLLKSSLANMVRDEIFINEFDLSYIDKIFVQLNMCESIAQMNENKWMIIVLDLPIVTASMIELIKKFDRNVIVFVVTERLSFRDKVSNVLYFGSKSIFDCSSEERLYVDILNNAPIYLEMEELLQMLDKMFFIDQIPEHKFIIDLMNS